MATLEQLPWPRHVGLPRSRRSLLILGGTVLAVLIVVRIGLVVARSGTATSSEVASAGAPAIEVPVAVLAAHGVLQPVSRANVASLGGGSVVELSASVGQPVEKGQLLARVAGATGQAELVTAPWTGTITGVSVHVGDSVLPGAVLLQLADPTRYQVETTDVDEYLVGRLRPLQGASVTIDALPDRTLRGTVTSVSGQLQTPQAGTAGTPNYPTIIALAGAAPDLRPGLTVHILFDS